MSGNGFSHEALLFGDEAEFLSATVPFVAEGVQAEEPVLAALPRAHLSALRGALGGQAGAVRFVAMEELGRNPGRILPAWREFVDARPSDGRGIRGIGEPVWDGRDSGELTECFLHEELLNRAFRDTADFTLLCPYDTAALDEAVIAEAQRTHPTLRDRAAPAPSAGYRPGSGARHFRSRLPEPRAMIRQASLPRPPDAAALRGFRGRVAAHGRECGLDEIRVWDLVAATQELVNNALQHGRGEVTVRWWREPDAAVVEVRDQGQLADPMLGRARPASGALRGRGLWLANQVCDLVQARATPDGTTVRIGVTRGPSPPG